MQTRPASGSAPDPMSDVNLVEAIAVDVISCEGSRALPLLYENAELAYTIGDQVAAACGSISLMRLNGCSWTVRLCLASRTFRPRNSAPDFIALSPITRETKPMYSVPLLGEC